MRPYRLFALGILFTVAVAPPAAAAVGPLPATDRELAAAVETTLSRDREVRDLRLKVSAVDGVVSLSGTVPRLGLKQAAVRLAAGQRGVLEIRDDMELATGDPADRTVLLRVESRLAPHVDLREPVLEVRVEDGVVRARGQVGTIGRLLFLRELLGEVLGVRAVDLDEVRVETEANRHSDDKVLHDGILALLRNPLVFPVSGRIEVEVAGGEVTLSGEVPRLIDSMEAAFVAGLVGGVRHVNNEIVVDPQHGRMRVREFSATN